MPTPGGERQRIEIVRWLLQDPKLVILDEPTSVLTPARRRGCSRSWSDCNPQDETARSLAAMMVGTQVRAVTPKIAPAGGRERLRRETLDLRAPGLHATSLRGLSLSVAGSEILGIAGNGQAELFAALSGRTLAPRPYAVRIDAAVVGRRGIDARRRLGAALLPEERDRHAAAPTMRLSENAVLSRHPTAPLARLGPLRRLSLKSDQGRGGGGTRRCSGGGGGGVSIGMPTPGGAGMASPRSIARRSLAGPAMPSVPPGAVAEGTPAGAPTDWASAPPLRPRPAQRASARVVLSDMSSGFPDRGRSRGALALLPTAVSRSGFPEAL